MEVLIYIAGALVTFAVILLIVDRGDIGIVEHAGLAFGFAGVWPIIWMLCIPCAIMAAIEHYKEGKTSHGRRIIAKGS